MFTKMVKVSLLVVTGTWLLIQKSFFAVMASGGILKSMPVQEISPAAP